ncbi:unnamed protein product [Phytophthora lilii]|uniref:Unnamed protein product n=1 Tax=Phytophthora lilii TaxID=2077276 RepID=A0A9W6TJM8_9STRA|nr:unnamed protein product [Phytophthora lilii]
MKMNFLNPAYECYYDLWRNHGTSKEEGFAGNYGPSKQLFTPATPSLLGLLSKTSKWINSVAVVRAIQRQKPVDAEAFKDCMNALVRS